MEDDNIANTKTQTLSKESSKGSKKGPSPSSSSSQRLQEQQQQQQQALKCPRCDSMNTKFCYYNNYCLAQPRHFCKTCRRYWTKGGAIRNVPIGGGCRKSKKLKPSSLNSSRESPTTSFDIGRLKFFHGFPSSSSPTIDFELGGLSIPRLNLSSTPSSGVVYNQLSSSSFGDIEGSSLGTQNICFNLDPSLGFNLAFPPLFKQQSDHENNALYDGVGNQDDVFIGSQVAASIESLSSINQDLHWKLQQQRFASMMFGGNRNGHQSEKNVSQGLQHQEIQRPQPILFQNLDLSPRTSGGYCDNYERKKGQSSNLATEYFFDDTSAPTMNSTRSTTSNGANNGNENVRWSIGAQAWNNLDQFDALP